MIGLNALAAPIFDALGTFVGAIAIVDSIQFIPEDPSAKQIRQTVEAGKKISTTIGISREPGHAMHRRPDHAHRRADAEESADRGRRPST